MIQFDPTNALVDQHGLTQADLDAIAPELMKARDIVAEDVAQIACGNIPEDKRPLEAGYIELPRKLLQEYRVSRAKSELGQLLATAKRIQDQVDRVVVLGNGGSSTAARALMEACREPYFNELSRGQRGGRPRIYFEGNSFDNDAIQGLVQLLDAPVDGFEDPYAIVVSSSSGGKLETAVAFRTFLDHLKSKLPGREDRLKELVVPVTGESGKLFDLSEAIGVKDRCYVPDGIGEKFSILSAVGLLPAAIMGLDVVALLEGAVEMNDHFRSAEPGSNAVLDYVATNHLLEKEQGMQTRVLSVWSKGLEYVGHWYDQLLVESPGKAGMGAFPLTAVNTRDLHSRAQQQQEGRRDKIINNLIVDSWRCDPIKVQKSEWDQDQLNAFAGKDVPEIMNVAIAGTNQAYREDNRPTTTITLPECSERWIGQFVQMMMLATSVEGRLMDIKPYGQPGVEKYEQNMFRILRGE